MRRTVSIWLVTDKEIEEPSIADLSSEIRRDVSPRHGGRNRHTWVVPESAWPDLPRLRSRLRESVERVAEVQLFESCSPRIDDADLDAASLVHLAIPSSLTVRPRGPDPVTKERCSACGRQTLELDRSVLTSIDAGTVNRGVLTLGDHGLLALSAGLWRELEDAGLASGVERIPLATATHEPYHVLWPSMEIPIASAPYGWASPPCPNCRGEVARHAFFPVYPRPTPSPDWARFPNSATISPLVSNRVFRFLKQHMAQMSPPAKLQGMVHGWLDTDATLAFLPEEFHGTEP